MIISVINFTHGKIGDDVVQTAVRAINRQIAEDFEPYWSFGATLRLEGRIGREPDATSLAEMRGDGVLYLWDGHDIDGAVGYHETNHRGIPYGFVFTDVSQALGENWTTTLSHEALEMVGDPQANLLVQGPHPTNRDKTVFHWFEMCDAVQAQTYRIDDVEVSNFVLPLYFTRSNETASRNDFLGSRHRGAALVSFGVNPGGYVGYFDPATGKHKTYSAKADEKAKERLRTKQRLRSGRGQMIRKASIQAMHARAARG